MTCNFLSQLTDAVSSGRDARWRHLRREHRHLKVLPWKQWTQVYHEAKKLPTAIFLKYEGAKLFELNDG